VSKFIHMVWKVKNKVVNCDEANCLLIKLDCG